MTRAEKLTKLEEDLKIAIEGAVQPALLFSAGKDSILLLDVLCSLDLEVSLISFPHLWTPRQVRQAIDETGGKMLFHYAPVDIRFKSPYAISSYGIGGRLIMIYSKRLATNRCGLEVGKRAIAERHVQPMYFWDLTIVGTKELDEQLGQPFTFQELSGEGHRFVAPLWDWTDEEVLEELKARGRDGFDSTDPERDTGTFMACTACMETSHDSEVHCPKEGRPIPGLL